MTLHAFEVRQFEILGQHIREYAGATKDGQNAALKLAVKQYIPHQRPSPKQGKKDVTIVAAGGNGFPKELYEPLWEDLLRCCTEKSIGVKAIWMADMAHQGQSGMLNGSKLGDDYSWFDLSRDLLALINHFRDEMSTPLIGVGHSTGASALISLSCFHPRLFSELVLFEPILGYTSLDGQKFDCTVEGAYFAHATSRKPDTWPSKAAAEKAMAISKPFVNFDPRVFARWLQHGLISVKKRGDGSAPVTLVTSKVQEAITYVRPLFDPQKKSVAGEEARRLDQTLYPDFDQSISGLQGFYCPASSLILSQLPGLRPKVLYVIGGESIMFPKEKRQRVLETTGIGVGGNGGQRDGAVKEVVLPGQGHLLTFESVSRCAEVAASHIAWCKAREKPGPVLSSVDGITMQLTERWREQAKCEVERAKQKKAKL